MIKIFCDLCGGEIIDWDQGCQVILHNGGNSDELEICKGCYSVIDDCISKLRTEDES
jgi:hypothetical protein